MPLDGAGGPTRVPLIRLYLGVGLGEHQDGHVMAGGSPFDERPTQRLQVVDYVGLAVPDETAPAAAAWAT